MFNTNAEDSYSYYDAQGRYLTTKHVYHLPDGTLKFTLDNTHSNPKDSFNLKNELLFYHLRNLVNERVVIIKRIGDIISVHRNHPPVARPVNPSAIRFLVCGLCCGCVVSAC